MASSYFGPNASRPIIRGLDGDRVRVLQNSGVSADASGVSADHAVPADPIAAERIEVLRGPATLLYGGSAVAAWSTSSTTAFRRNASLTQQAVWVGACNWKPPAAMPSARRPRCWKPTGPLYLRMWTAFHRQSGDVGVLVDLPAMPAAPSPAPEPSAIRRRKPAVAVGGAVFANPRGWAPSVSSYHSDYGTVAEDSVTIGMCPSALRWSGIGRAAVAGA